MATEDVDVAVVGGGLVGATLVHALRDTTLTVALIDRNNTSEAQRDPRSTALAYASQRLLDDLDLWATVAHTAAPIKTVHVSQQGHFGKVTLAASDMQVAALGYVLPNRALAQALAGQIEQQSNCLSLAPDAVTMLRTDDDSVAIGLDSGRSVRARLVVAADGAQSDVRAFSAIGVRREVTFDQHAVVANLEGSGWPQSTAWERFCNYGPLALLPQGDNTLSLAYTVPDRELDRVLSLNDVEFAAEIGMRTGLPGTIDSVSTRHSFPLTSISADSPWQGRVALVGNALRTLHPVAGQGFNLALRDCLTLAELLRGCTSEQDPADPSLARQYTRRRRADQLATQIATEGFARLFQGDSPVIGHLRGLGLVLTDRVSPLRHQLARQFMGLGGRLPNLKRIG